MTFGDILLNNFRGSCCKNVTGLVLFDTVLSLKVEINFSFNLRKIMRDAHEDINVLPYA